MTSCRMFRRFQDFVYLAACTAFFGFSAACPRLQAQVQFVPTMTPYAGTAGTTGYGGTNIALSAALFNHPTDVAFDKYGNMFVADEYNEVVRQITPSGAVYTIAGTQGTAGYQGDGDVSVSARFNYPTGVAVDANENIYISDTDNNLLRVVIPIDKAACIAGTSFTNGANTYYGCTGNIYTVAGNCASSNLSATETAGTQIANYAAFSSSTGVSTATCSASTDLDFPTALAIDSSNNVYIANAHGNGVLILTFSPSGLVPGSGATVTNATMARYAGSGSGGYAGDGGTATSAKVNNPYGVALDANDNLYIADTKNYVIRFVPASGTNQGKIFTVAGTTTCTGVPTGGIFGTTAATACSSETAGSDGAITANNGNGGPALNTSTTTGTLVYAQRVAIDKNGNLLIADTNAAQLRIVNMTSPGVAGNIYALAGMQTAGHNSVTGAIGGELSGLLGVTTDAANNIYIADTSNAVIRKVSATVNPPAVTASVNPTTAPTLTDYAFLTGSDAISSTAGLQTAGYFSVTQGSSACSALYLAGSASDGNINGVAGSLCSTPVTFTPLAPGLSTAPLVILDSNSNSYSTGLAGIGTSPAVAFTPGTLSTVAGTTAGSGTGQLDLPSAAVMDSYGNLYIADTANHAIREIAAGGTALTTIAGAVGVYGYSGDGGLASAALFHSPSALALDAAGNLFIADTGNHCIREIEALTGTIQTAAGICESSGFSGDDGAATAAQLASPSGVAVDISGDLFIADTGNQRIREVVPPTPVTGASGVVKLGSGSTGVGVIYTIAGTGTATSTGDYSSTSGDGGLAVDATFHTPTGLALDSAGSLFVADTQNATVRKIVLATHIISTVAGNGSAGYSGDGGTATGATLSAPGGVAVDAGGNLYIADTGNDSIRQVLAGTGNIYTLATGETALPSGDMAAILNAPFSQPAGIALDPNGRIYIADTGNSKIRMIDTTVSSLSFGTVNPGNSSLAQTAVVTNIGNQTLTFTNLSIAAPFTQQSSGGTDCTAATTLADGQSCNVQLVFQPPAIGNYSSTIGITDDALNLSGSVQAISISGVSDVVPTALTVAGMPGTTVAGVTQTLSISAVNGTETATDYKGTVHFTSTDAKAVLPADYTYTSSDQGVHSFSVTFETAGAQSVSIADTGNVNLTGSAETTVAAAAAASIAVLSGNNQTGQLLSAFPSSLTAQVVDAYGNGIPETAVVFTAPASGASGTFSNGTATITVTTDANGDAATSFTANSVSGSYSVTASSGSLSPATFDLINSGALPTALSLSLAPAVTSLPYGESVTLNAVLNPSTNGGTAATGTVTFTDTCCTLGAATLGTASLGSGAASYTDAVPITGSHSFSASYSGDANFAASLVQTAVAFTVTKASVTLTGPATTPVTVNVGQTGQIAVTIAGQFSGTNIVAPTGSLTYQIGAAASGTAPIALGAVTIPIPSTLSAGSYSVAITYPGDGNYQTASLDVPLTIAGQSQTITFNTIANHTYGDAPFALSATASSGLTPTFSVISGPATVSGGTLSLTGAGAVVVAADQPGSATYAAAPQVTQSFTVAPAALTVAANNTSRIYGHSNPAFTGTVTGAVNGDTFTETFTTTATTNSPAGTYPIVPSVAGTNLASYTRTIVNGTLTVTAPPTPADTLASSVNPELALNPVTFTATISGSNGSATGTVNFLDGSTVLGTGTVSSGVATYTTSALTAGTHTITAVYSGDTNYSAATSAELTQTMIDISLSVPSSGATSQTALPGGSATYVLAVAPSSGTSFPTAVTMSVTGLPSGATAAVTPSSWVLSSNDPWSWTLPANTSLTANTQLAIQLPQLAASAGAEQRRGISRWTPLAFALLLLPLAGRLRRAGKQMRRIASLLLLLAGSMTALAGLSGCGAGGGFLAQAQKSYQITVTLSSGGLSRSTTLTLTVE